MHIRLHTSWRMEGGCGFLCWCGKTKNAVFSQLSRMQHSICYSGHKTAHIILIAKPPFIFFFALSFLSFFHFKAQNKVFHHKLLRFATHSSPDHTHYIPYYYTNCKCIPWSITINNNLRDDKRRAPKNLRTPVLASITAHPPRSSLPQHQILPCGSLWPSYRLKCHEWLDHVPH